MAAIQIQLDGRSLTLDAVVAIAEGAKIAIAPSARHAIDASWRLVQKMAKGSQPVYGVNTGFGYLASKCIPENKRKQHQLNLIQSHAAGYGEPLSIEETRAAMALRLNVLIKGFTGVRYALCKALENLINAEIYPIIPEYGSVGASGDLAPLAHLALPLVGLGSVRYRGRILPSIDALRLAKLRPIQLKEKEGLGLINGTQIMLAVGGLAVAQAWDLVIHADRIAALTFEALQGNQDALFNPIHHERRHEGQIQSARFISSELKGSTHKGHRLQDPYSLRCAPQIHGPTREVMQYVCAVIERELNAATDNPLVFVDEKRIVSGGNFHGQPLALAFDIAGVALSGLGGVSERRLELLLNPNMSGLPAFLTPEAGLESGYMAMQYLSASIVNENKVLAHPACVDSIPGNVGVEDYVSMGMTAAKKWKKIVQNVRVVLAAELLAAAQAIDIRGVRCQGKGTRRTYEAIRERVPMMKHDRVVSEDIAKAVDCLKEWRE